MTVNLTTHVSGLASGMDTEKIVSDLMKVNRIPLDKLQQAKTLNSWKTDAYREINTKIASFRDAMQDLRLEGTFNAQKVTSGDPSIEVSMAGTSTQKSFTISGAQPAVAAKAASVSFDTKIVKGSDKLFTDPATAVDLTFTLNGQAITIGKDSTFDQAIATINGKSDLTNVKVSNVGGSLVFNSTSVGASSSITITNSSAEATSKLKVTDGTTTLNPISPQTNFASGSYTNGADAVTGYATINGTKVNVSSNTFTYDGVQFTLKQGFPDGSKNIGVSVTADTDKVFDKIKTFVDKYNDLIKDINDKISEKKFRDYPPLSNEQKKDMKDEDIKLWEDKAKSGLLANDPTLRRFLTQIRTSINETVEGSGINTSFDTLQEIGIKSSTNYKENGKLTLDESKLKSLLTSNMADIQKVFSTKFDTGVTSDTTVTNPTKYKKSGFGVRIYDRIADTLSSLRLIAGAPGTVSLTSNLAKEATSIDESMAKVQDRLSTQEQSLWAKFNAMESALQKMNSQSSWLYQQLGQ